MGGAHNNSKAELRRELGGLQRDPDPGDVAMHSRAICARVVASAVFNVTDHLVGYAARSWEVDPSSVLRAARASGRRVYYPRVEGTMLRFRQAGPEELAAGRFGIMEPPVDGPVLDRSVGRVTFLIPGVAFDRRGTRLGSGWGYYDRALPEYAGRSTWIGMVFDRYFAEYLPRDPWDVPVHLVATETGLFTTDRGVGAPAGET